MNDKLPILIFSMVIFFIAFFIGIFVASKKPLWNDEIFSQVSSVEKVPIKQVLEGKVREGSNSPLFYLIQKATCSLAHYRFPGPWDGSLYVNDAYGQLILRLNPIICTSLLITFIFCYFALYHSFWTGIYSIGISFSSFMIWNFYGEARPYALWMLLTALQSIALFVSIKTKEWKWSLALMLAGIHFLLAITSIFSIFQISSAFVVLFILWRYKWRWDYVYLFLIPSAIALFYYIRAPKYNFRFVDGPMELIGASLPLDRMVFIIIILFIIAYAKYIQKISLKDIFRDRFRQSSFYLIFCACMAIVTVFIISVFKINENLNDGFQISNRYFTYLTPLGIIAVTLFSEQWFVFCKKNWQKFIVGIFLIGLLYWRANRSIALSGWFR